MSADAVRPQTPARRPGGPDARRWWALVAIAASVLVVGLDLTILNLALPVLSVQLHASTTDLQWFSASYSLVLAAALLPAGMLGDRAGRKKMLLIALVVFGASSAACAYAASATAPVTMSLIPSPEANSAPPVENWMMPSLPASANPFSAALIVSDDVQLIAGNA